MSEEMEKRKGKKNRAERKGPINEERVSFVQNIFLSPLSDVSSNSIHYRPVVLYRVFHLGRYHSMDS